MAETIQDRRALKAFAVTEDYENTGGVFFARHAIAARRHGADQFADGDISSVTCRRAPWADEFAGRAVPAKVMIANGWHFECHGCGQHIDVDWLYDNRLPIDGVIGKQHGPVYCCSRCARKHISLQRRRKNEEQRAIAAYKAIVRRRFPDADFCDDEQSTFRGHHANVVPGRGGWHWNQVIVSFRFPGMKIGPARFRRDEPCGNKTGPVRAEYSCCNGDREAFEAYARTSHRTEGEPG